MENVAPRIILASASPRRSDLMKQAGFRFEVFPANGEEQPGERSPEDTVRFLSRQKAGEVAAHFCPELNGRGDLCGTERREREAAVNFTRLQDKLIVIGADTVVSLEKEILGKPRDRADARRMLAMLSGRTHEVWTGVTVIGIPVAEDTDTYDPFGGIREITFAECTEVDVEHLTEAEIDTYLASGEADDKAGAYGIQGRFGIHIRGIRGDYNNVVGLPIAALYRVLRDNSFV